MSVSPVVLVTGASGFVGNAVVNRVRSAGFAVRAAVRTRSGTLAEGVQPVICGDVGSELDWSPMLEGCDTVVHAAARVHVMRETASGGLDEFRRVNATGTLRLASQAAAVGVRRFIFLSSIKVNGEATSPGRPFRPDDAARPEDAYAISKWEAEQGLLSLAGRTGMEVVIIRPVLVYGPGVGANFLSLIRSLERGIPLPLGAIDNRRSLVSLQNLSDLIMTCIAHPAAANQVFLISDGEDLSTTELLSRLGRALGKPARLVPLPPGILRTALGLLGKGHVAQRLCSSLQVDISKTREALQWTPPIAVDEAFWQLAQARLRKSW